MAWMRVAFGSLVLAGLFAIFIVVARLPGISGAFTDPLFFRRCLVAHVDLALGVWFYAALAMVFSLIRSAGSPSRVAQAGPWVTTTGMVLMLAGAGVRGAEPVLANYLPVIDSWVFLAGLGVVAAGISMSILGGRLWPREGERAVIAGVPSSALTGGRSAAVAFLLALLTLGVSLLVTPEGLDARAYYELLFWGPGHVLQVANVLAMVAVWCAMVGQVTGEDPIPARVAPWIFASMVLPIFPAPLITGTGTTDVSYHATFTTLMRWTIFPGVLVALVYCIRAVVRTWRQVIRGAWDERLPGFAASAAMTLVGFVLGALIRGPDTMVPAHYHAAIGAVTVGYMTLGIAILRARGREVPEGRLRRLLPWQPILFGGGQILFAVGFAMAGSPRKVYGTEQHIRTVTEAIGLGVMGAGGLVAVSGGILLLVILVAALRAGRPGLLLPFPRSGSWKTKAASIPSRS